jgi:hypothetical protein
MLRAKPQKFNHLYLTLCLYRGIIQVKARVLNWGDLSHGNGARKGVHPY